MAAFAKILRRILANRGFLLPRCIPEIPPTLLEYLSTLDSLGVCPANAVCFDNEAQTQVELMQVFKSDRISFTTPTPNAPDSAWRLKLIEPAGRFLVEIDASVFPPAALLEKVSWLTGADLLLLRMRLGAFWTGETDLQTIAAAMRLHGFVFNDAIDYARLALLQAPDSRIILVFMPLARPAKIPLPSKHSRYRLNEALAFLNPPLARRGDAKLLAGHGSFGFDGGIFNPGADWDGSQLNVIARAESSPWTLQKKDQGLFFSSCQPVKLSLSDNRDVTTATPLSITGAPDRKNTRLEDFRLFRFKNRLYTNHSVISQQGPAAPSNSPLSLSNLKTRVGLAEIDLNEDRMIWLGSPTVDVPLSPTEKNWATFSNDEQLYLLYSFNPYRLLSATAWPNLDFQTCKEARLLLPFDGDGISVRNSVNPVSYDADHWLHVVHKVYPNKQYVFWPVMISKRTLLPVSIGRQPLVRGWESYPAAIHYLSSIVALPAEVIIFAGLDDSSAAMWAIPRARIDACLTPILEQN